VLEAEALGLGIGFGLGVVEREQIGLVRRRGVGEILGEKRELLSQPPTDDGVVVVETHLQRLAVVDLLADPLLDEAGELLLGRRPAHLGLPLVADARYLRIADLDDVGVRARGREAVEGEDQRPGNEEADERVAQQLQCRGVSRAQAANFCRWKSALPNWESITRSRLK